MDDQIQQLEKSLAMDKLRPDQCTCGHSKSAHDSGYAFCWFCRCNEFIDSGRERDHEPSRHPNRSITQIGE